MQAVIVIAAVACVAWAVHRRLANKPSDPAREFVLRSSMEAAETPVDRALIFELVRMRKVYAYGVRALYKEIQSGSPFERVPQVITTSRGYMEASLSRLQSLRVVAEMIGQCPEEKWRTICAAAEEMIETFNPRGGLTPEGATRVDCFSESNIRQLYSELKINERCERIDNKILAVAPDWWAYLEPCHESA